MKDNSYVATPFVRWLESSSCTTTKTVKPYAQGHLMIINTPISELQNQKAWKHFHTSSLVEKLFTSLSIVKEGKLVISYYYYYYYYYHYHYTSVLI